MSRDDLRSLQDQYLALVASVGAKDDALVDCEFPDITVGDLRRQIYPELEQIMRENLLLYSSRL